MQSFVALSARAVQRSCREAAEDIQAARDKILRNAVDKYRRRAWYLPDLSYTEALAKTPDAEKEISRFHRADELRKIDSLREVAEAACMQCEDFTVHVTSEAYQLIKDHYPEAVMET